MAIRDVLLLDDLAQVDALLKPQPIAVLRQLAEPRSCTDVADRLRQTPQRVYYHVRRLLVVELVQQVAERKVRGIREGIYQASARAYWVSPQLVGRIGTPRQVQDALSLGFLLELVESVQSDIARLDRARPELPSLGVSAEIRVAPERRQAFMDELQHTLQDLFSKYGGSEGDAFKLAIACYPNPKPEGDTTA